MTIMQSVRDILEGWGSPGPEIPEGAVAFTGQELYAAITERGESAWNCYRLAVNGGTVDKESDGLFPLISNVCYLEVGEGDAPTVYITARNGGGCYPLMLDCKAYLIPA